jgi:hypothetical protein
VLLEISDGAFSSAEVMAVGRHQLILYVIGGEKMIQSGLCLIVESLEFWFETFGSELLMEVIMGVDPF